mmetsp:Transcript_22410/g.59155  ORF Transcript_22410/g.59155 Transcript_22410/m.59155 type:complete len:345 (+) Transcript_22410:125-1159(+)
MGAGGSGRGCPPWPHLMDEGEVPSCQLLERHPVLPLSSGPPQRRLCSLPDHRAGCQRLRGRGSEDCAALLHQVRGGAHQGASRALQGGAVRTHCRRGAGSADRQEERPSSREGRGAGGGCREARQGGAAGGRRRSASEDARRRRRQGLSRLQGRQGRQGLPGLRRLRDLRGLQGSRPARGVWGRARAGRAETRRGRARQGRRQCCRRAAGDRPDGGLHRVAEFRRAPWRRCLSAPVRPVPVRRRAPAAQRRLGAAARRRPLAHLRADVWPSRGSASAGAAETVSGAALEVAPPGGAAEGSHRGGRRLCGQAEAGVAGHTGAPEEAPGRFLTTWALQALLAREVS